MSAKRSARNSTSRRPPSSQAIGSSEIFNLKPTQHSLSTSSAIADEHDSTSSSALGSTSMSNLQYQNRTTEQGVIMPLKDHERPTTPPPKNQEMKAALHATPQSAHSGSFTGALPYIKTYIVEDMNRYLAGDLMTVRVLSIKDWALCSLNLDVDLALHHKLNPESNDAFKNYLKVVDKAKSEKDPDLYPALVKLLNSCSSESDKIVFYQQDPNYVYGSMVFESPDVGAVYKELFVDSPASEEKSSPKLKKHQKMLWSHILDIVECKHEHGKMVIEDFSPHIYKVPSRYSGQRDPKEPKASSERLLVPNKRAGNKRGREEDAPDDSRPGPALKTRRSNTQTQLFISVEGASSSSAGSILPASSGYSSSQSISLTVSGRLPDRKTPLGVRYQIAGYARDVLSFGLPRTHTIIFLVDSKLARGILYDRSVIVESGVFNLADTEDQVLFAKIIQHLRTLNSEQLGLVPHFQSQFIKDPFSLRYYKKLLKPTADSDMPPSNGIFKFNKGSCFKFPYKKGTFRTVKVGRILYRSNGIIGRGPIVVRVKCDCEHNGQCDWCGKKLVLKSSFPSKTRVSEQAFMDKCKEKVEECKSTGEHTWVLNHLPKIYWAFDYEFAEDSPQNHLKKHYGDEYELRVMRGVIMEELMPLSSLDTAEDCAQVFYDVVQCHHWAWKYPQILHRDISHGNIMVRHKDGQKYGVLNDWDLAIWANDQQAPSSSKFRTGTKPYMAYEQHGRSWKGPHMFRHDLESVFYVLLLLAALHSSPGKKASEIELDTGDSAYELWHKADHSYLHGKKAEIVGNGDWTLSVQPFFDGFIPWLASLRRSLRHGHVAFGFHREAMEDAAAKLKAGQNAAKVPFFNEETLGENFSYKTVVLVMHKFNGQELKTRGQEWEQLELQLS